MLRYQAASPREYPSGRRPCRFCGGPCTPPRRTFCGDVCVEEFLVRGSHRGIRRRCFERDKGVCALCRTDVHALVEQHPRGRERSDLFHNWKAGRQRETLWEADHIVPISLGGSNEPENIRTLCLRCHRSETTRLNVEGAEFRARVAA